MRSSHYWLSKAWRLLLDHSVTSSFSSFSLLLVPTLWQASNSGESLGWLGWAEKQEVQRIHVSRTHDQRWWGKLRGNCCWKMCWMGPGSQLDTNIFSKLSLYGVLTCHISVKHSRSHAFKKKKVQEKPSFGDIWIIGMYFFGVLKNWTSHKGQLKHQTHDWTLLNLIMWWELHFTAAVVWQ